MRISGVIQTVRFQPDNAAVMYVTSGFGVGGQILSSGGLYKTIDGGKNWRALTNGLPDPIVNDTLVDPSSSSVVLAGTYTGGIYRSSDAGASWTLVKATHKVTQFAVVDNNLYATSSDGVLISTDHGSTWSVSLGPKQAATPNAIVASGKTLYSGFTDGQFFSYEGGQWIARSTLPMPRPLQSIAVDPATPSTLFATVDTGLGNPLFRSLDGGRTWTSLPIPAGLRAIQGMAYSKVTPHMAYFVGGGAVASTTDNGATMKSGAGRGDQRNIVLMPDGKGGEDCYVPGDQGLVVVNNCADPARISTQRNLTHDLALSVPPGIAVTNGGKTILLAVQDYTAAVTYDGGATWDTTASMPNDNDPNLGRLAWEDGFVAVNTAKPNLCYGFQWDGRWSYSEDGCHHFSVKKIATIVPQMVVGHTIANDFKEPSKVYLAAWNDGVMKSTDYGRTMRASGWPFKSVNGVYVDPNDGNRILVTTVDSATRQNLQLSTDGGRTWATIFQSPATATALAVDIAASTTSGVPGVIAVAYVSPLTSMSLVRSTDGGKHFSPPVSFSTEQNVLWMFTVSLAVNPLNPSVIAAASQAGVVASADAGATWQRIDGDSMPHIFQAVAWSDGYLYVTALGKGVLKTTRRLQ